MNRSDDFGRRRRPDQQYGGYEEGYGHVPGDDRNLRRRDLSGGRYGNASERNPYDANEDRDARTRNADDDPGRRDAWRQGRTAQLSGGWRSRGAAVYYPGRPTYESSQDESTPHGRGYVTAYSSGYEDGYDAGTRTSASPVPGRQERWSGTQGGYDSGYESRYGRGRGDRQDRGYGRGDNRGDDRRYGASSGGTGYEDYGVGAGRNFRQRPKLGESVHGRGPEAYGRRAAGPKNYTRSDERIREEVCERLTHAPTLDVSEVTVSVAGGVVTLTGSVDNRRMKYAVEDLADDTYGVTDVINQIHVRPYGVLASE